MRIETAFLRSAVARRVFWVVLAAAALPLLVFTALAYGTLNERLESHLNSRLHEAAKYAGLRVYDRLIAAQTSLAALAVSASKDKTGHLVPQAVREVFHGVVRIDDAGAIDGPQELAETWQRLDVDQGRAIDPTRRRLWWQAASGMPARVLLGVRTAQAWWIGEVAPTYLWGELRDRDAFVGTCVADVYQRPLLCPPELLHTDAVADARDGMRSVSWTLFTRADFGTVDWVFTRRSSRAQLFQGELPLEQVAWKAALFSLLLVAGLSLVLVRRTTVPLERLIDGTRRLARHDWTARVQVDAADEFGELAGSFNQMAGRIERQVQALQVQAGIDHVILSSMDVPRVLAQVANRLQALAPASCVALLLAPGSAAGRWQRVAVADRAQGEPDAGAPVDGPPPQVEDVAIDPDLVRQIGEGPTVLAGAAAGALMPLLACGGGKPPRGELNGSHAPVTVVPVRTGDRLRALMLLQLPPDVVDDARAEAEELAARLAVMMVAADRERELRTRAVFDSLTGLLNRAGLIEALDERLVCSDQPFVLAFVDLDGFKAVNDTRGHPVGDALLAEVAACLRAVAPPDTLLARPGGDEFVLLLQADVAAADAVAATLCQRLGTPLVVQGQAVHIGASIGLVRYPEHGRDRVELMRRADLAMYASKATGRGRFAWFEQAFDERAAARAWVQSELPGALLRNELCLHFQPRVKAQGGGLASVEALVRWRHPLRGLIPPMQFISLAEETGQIEDLGRWVLDAACRQQRRWIDAGVPVPRVAVNVSALQLAAPDFAAHLLSVLQRHRLQPAQLEVELTESLFAGDPDEVIERLMPLREAGVQIALDDFGTGFSSLSSLHRLPVDVLKIDRSFVVDLGRRDSADAVARTIVALARALGKYVVAEGIETEDQRLRLLALGCDEFQGYLFGRPLTPEALQLELARAAPPSAPQVHIPAGTPQTPSTNGAGNRLGAVPVARPS